MKFWFIRISATVVTMGSFAIGPLVGAEYGLWAGLGAFIASVALGIYLHRTADKMRNRIYNNIQTTDEIEQGSDQETGFNNNLLSFFFIFINIISLFFVLQITTNIFNTLKGDSIFIRLIFLTGLVLIFGIIRPNYNSSPKEDKYVLLGISLLLLLLLSLFLFLGILT